MLATFAEVRVVATGPALRFFNSQQLPFACRQIYGDEDDWREWRGKGDPVVHIELRKWADVLLVAPMSANTLAKAAQGLCDNLLTCVLRAWDFSKPCLAAPAMNTAMWDHPLTGQQLQTLQGFGWQLIDPIAKQLACGDVGLGAMEEPPAIADAVGRASHEYLTRPSGFNPAGQPQAPSVVDAFQQAVPTHMQQRPGSMPRPDLMRSGFRPPAARPIANGLAPLKPYSNGPPFGNGPGARPFNQGNFAAENDFGRFGMPLPNIVPPVGMPSANSFVKAQSSEFGVNEITTIAAKRARFETDL